MSEIQPRMTARQIFEEVLLQDKQITLDFYDASSLNSLRAQLHKYRLRHSKPLVALGAEPIFVGESITFLEISTTDWWPKRFVLSMKKKKQKTSFSILEIQELENDPPSSYLPIKEEKQFGDEAIENDIPPS